MVTIEDHFKTCFTQKKLDALFPPERANQFFDALFGDAEEGAYDIRLTYQDRQENHLRFFLELHQRPGKCLTCNRTYGLPKVFTRHPIINMEGLITQINKLIKDQGRCRHWELKATKEISRQLHVVPLVVEFEPSLSAN